MIPTNLHFVSRPFFTPRLHHQFPLRRSSAMSAGAANPNPNPNPPIPPSTTKTVRVVIKGRVQGVFFRDWTVQNARKLGLNGWVRNRRDGSVEALFSGDPAAVDDMVGNRCPVGPTYAAVTGVSSSPSNDDPGRGFSCQPTA